MGIYVQGQRRKSNKQYIAHQKKWKTNNGLPFANNSVFCAKAHAVTKQTKCGTFFVCTVLSVSE